MTTKLTLPPLHALFFLAGSYRTACAMVLHIWNLIRLPPITWQYRTTRVQ